MPENNLERLGTPRDFVKGVLESIDSMNALEAHIWRKEIFV